MKQSSRGGDRLWLRAIMRLTLLSAANPTSLAFAGNAGVNTGDTKGVEVSGTKSGRESGLLDTGASAEDEVIPPYGSAIPSSALGGGEESLYLIASLNKSPSGQFVRAVRRADGLLSFRAGDLRQIRLRVPHGFGPDDMVPASAMPGVSFVYVDSDQALEVQAPDAWITPFALTIDPGREPLNLDDVHSLSGVLVNYGLYNTLADGAVSTTVSIEAVGMTRLGAFITSARVSGGSNLENIKIVREDSYWRSIDPAAIRSYTVGDFVSNAQSWTTPIRMAGIQIASAFDQRPDIVTAALPQFSGSAALPSTVDLYVNQQKIFSGEIPSGPFDIKQLPISTNGNIRLVTTDANGRQISVTKPFYSINGQIRKGLLEYSLDVGVPRLDYAVSSLSYDDVVVAGASVKYGLTEKITVEGAVQETTDGMVMAGGGVVASVAGRLGVQAAIAGSRYKGREGAKWSVRVEGGFGGIHYFAGTQRMIGDFFDLGRLATVRASRTNLASGDQSDAIAASAGSRITDQAGLSFQPWFDTATVALSYNRVITSTNRFETVNLSLSRSLGQRLSLYVNGYQDLQRRNNIGLFATLTLRAGKKLSATTQYNRTGGKGGYAMQLTSSGNGQQGELGWGLSHNGGSGQTSSETGYLNYRGATASAMARIDHSSGRVRGEFDVDGSFLIAGGGIFPSEKVTGGFVVIKNGGPHVDIMQGGVRAGRTNSHGRALLTNVSPFLRTRFFLDTATLPDGWDVEQTELAAVAPYRSGVLVDFKARKVQAASVALFDKSGKPVDPGWIARLENGEEGMIGYDGLVYLRGLNADNIVTVDRGLAGLCTAHFRYDPAVAPGTVIGPVTCQ